MSQASRLSRGPVLAAATIVAAGVVVAAVVAILFGGSDKTNAATTAATTTAAAPRAAPAPVQTQTSAAVTTQAHAGQTTTKGLPEPTASEYTDKVDALLSSSSATLERVKAFVPAVTDHRLTAGAAIAEARALVNARAAAVQTALRLETPAAFARSRTLLVQSLRLSVEDDRALLAWVQAYESGRNAQAELDRVTNIGAQTSAAKRQFLAVYGAARRAATGQSPASLPTSY